MVLSLFLFVVIIQLSRSTDTNSSFIVSEGHWRISLASESELRCPYGTSSCTGGELAGDFLCADSFSGLLCGNAVQNYYVDWVAQDSLQCSNFFVASSVFFPAVVVLAILIFVCSYVGQTQQVRSLRHLSLTQTTESISSANSRSKNLNLPMIRRNGASADNCISFLHKLKILVFATQVTNALFSLMPFLSVM